MLLFSAVSARLFTIALSADEYVAKLQSGFTLDIGVQRGDIYDCNDEKLVNESTEYYAAVPPDEEMISEVEGYDLSECEDTLKQGYPAAVRVDGGFSSDDIRVYAVNKRYGELCGAEHIIGYLDSEKNGAAGLEKAFDAELSGEKITAEFTRSAQGKILCGRTPQSVQKTVCGNVKTTLDKKIQQITYNAAVKNIKSGAVVVLDNKSGKIRAICSIPDIDPSDLESSINRSDSPFVNRALSAYNCGSVFKLCIAAAGLENGITPTYNCRGYCNAGNVRFGCLKNHGNVDLTKAIAYSCNSYFVNLGQNLGADICYRYAKLFGFGAQNTLCSGISDAKGTLNSIEDLRENAAAMGNFSFGQGEITASPLQIASMIQCIANGGRRIIPTLIESVTDKNGNLTKYEPSSPVRVMSEKNADALCDCMRATVKFGTGKNTAINGCDIGAKTATAQTGRYDENGKEYLQAWFAGFVRKDDMDYTIVVMADNGVSGGVSALPTFHEIAQNIVNIK